METRARSREIKRPARTTIVRRGFFLRDEVSKVSVFLLNDTGNNVPERIPEDFRVDRDGLHLRLVEPARLVDNTVLIDLSLGDFHTSGGLGEPELLKPSAVLLLDIESLHIEKLCDVHLNTRFFQRLSFCALKYGFLSVVPGTAGRTPPLLTSIPYEKNRTCCGVIRDDPTKNSQFRHNDLRFSVEFSKILDATLP